MRTCLRVLAILLVIPTVLLLLLAVTMLNLRLTLLNPAFLKQVPVRHKVYDRLPGLAIDVMLEELTHSNGEETVTELERTLGRQSLEEAVETLVPPAWMQQQVEQNVDAVFAWLEGRTAYPELRLELSDLREQIIAKNLREAVHKLFARLPPCGPGEDFLSGDYPHCRPTDAELDRIVEEATPELREALPQDISFQRALEEGEIEPEALETLEWIRGAYRCFVWSVWVAWLACLVLLGLALLLTARSLEQVLQWIGWPLLMAGGLEVMGLVIAFVTIPLSIEYGLVQLPLDEFISLILAAFASSLLNAFIRDVIGHWLMLAVGLMLLGAIAVAAAALIRRVKAEEGRLTNR